ncbi:MAG: GNAT family N-acetyltransferase [Alphaproteobacteria bacterium]|nr:GNAT family N-acetyltransferase [Alphaproteobacteria bacterium]
MPLSPSGPPDPDINARVAGGVSDLSAAQWDACAGGGNPFVSHAFLAALEQSGSVGPGTGWQPAPILIEDAAGQLAGALPAYLKSHSQGEYVFDHGWAEAWQRAGGQYYPKLQIAAPFTPVPGPRALAQSDDVARQLIAAAEALTDQNDLSSAHATFVAADQLELFQAADWLIREGIQYHWFNDGYRDFDDFLAALSSRKRKAIRKERAAAQAGLNIRALRGAEIEDAHWDAFWHFYQDTGARKWGRPYLTRRFFSEIGATMGDQILLFLAERDGAPIAGALNFLGSDALYGRYWGCTEDVPFLHFELCYYRAIEEAIALGLPRVEAGAQGEHKLARGYVATPTYSAHYIPHPGFRAAVTDFLARERRAVARDIDYLGELTPFRKGA